MSNSFSGRILSEKLSKLNSSQQSIMSLSEWCISHRKKAKDIVETWEKLFSSSLKVQRVSFLYLANDILQNSRCKGNEFVNEFWKVLPGALKSVYENGDSGGKNAVLRLVDIWDERKVFGSRSCGLKHKILGTEAPVPERNVKASNSIKVVRKDSNYIRIKLAVGGMPEKIITSYQSVVDDHFNEDAALNKCKEAFDSIGNLEKDVHEACSQGNLQGTTLIDELQEQDNILKRCIGQLEGVEVARTALISNLKEALEEQESKLKHLRTQLLMAKSESGRTRDVIQRLQSVFNPGLIATLSETSSVEQKPSAQSPTLSKAEEDHKKAAAEVADKLTACSSSALVLTSILSSIVAEDAAASNGIGGGSGGGASPGFFVNVSPIARFDKRPKLEKPMAPPPAQQLASIPLVPPQFAATTQPVSQSNPLLSFSSPNPLPPPPLQPYIQTNGAIFGFAPFRFGGTSISTPPPPPPPPPLLQNLPMGLVASRPDVLQPPPLPPTLPPLPKNQEETLAGHYRAPVAIGLFEQQTQNPTVPRH